MSDKMFFFDEYQFNKIKNALSKILVKDKELIEIIKNIELEAELQKPINNIWDDNDVLTQSQIYDFGLFYKNRNFF